MVTESHIIEFSIGDTYIHEYQLRRASPRSNTVEVSVPRDFVRRLARQAGLSYEDFIKQCKVVVFYGGGNELLYRFENKDGDGDGPKKD